MGLLTQILGGLAGRAGGGSTFGGAGGRSPFGGGGGASGGLLMSLLPVVLGMLANRSSAAGPGAGGGLGGNLGGVLGGMFGQGGAGSGGGGAGGGVLGNLVERFTQRGYGAQAASWVGTGENQPLPPHALDEVFGEQALQQIAQQAGVSVDDARSGLSTLLPEVVDHFTPQGEMPPADQFSSTLGDMLQQFER